MITVIGVGKYHFKNPIEFELTYLEGDNLWELSNKELCLYVYEENKDDCLNTLEEDLDDLFFLYEEHKDELSESSIKHIEALKTHVEIRDA